MTADAWKSLIIKLLLMVLTPLALQMHLQADTTVLTMLATDAADALVLLYGIYRTYNGKNVPHDAIALQPLAGPLRDLKSGDHVGIDTGDNATGGVAKVVGAILLAFALSLFALVPPATAQGIAPRPVAASPVTKSFLDIIKTWVSSDIEGAITLSTAIPDLQDQTGATCWKTFRGIGDVITAHPLPVTLKLASDVQAARLVAMALKKVCVEPACAQVWLDMQNQVAALAPIGIPFTLNSICSKVL